MGTNNKNLSPDIHGTPDFKSDRFDNSSEIVTVKFGGPIFKTILETNYWWALSKWPIICLFLIKTQHAHLNSIHILDSECLQIEHVQLVLSSLLGWKEIVLSSGESRLRSRDLTTSYNQYVKRTMPTIISIRLNTAERNVNRIAPNMSIAIAKTRSQRSGFDALEFMSRPPLLLLLLALFPVGLLSPSASTKPP